MEYRMHTCRSCDYETPSLELMQQHQAETHPKTEATANKAIRDLHGRWKFNADLMTCQKCGYSVFASRIHETAHHAAGCKNEGDKNPWSQLAEILDAAKAGHEEVTANA